METVTIPKERYEELLRCEKLSDYYFILHVRDQERKEGTFVE